MKRGEPWFQGWLTVVMVGLWAVVITMMVDSCDPRSIDIVFH